jgi:hypothetical protein
MILRVYEGWEESIGGNLGPETVPEQPVSNTIRIWYTDAVRKEHDNQALAVVFHADHLAVVARMQGEIDALKAQLAEAEDWNKTSKEHQEHWLGRFVEAQRRRIDALKLELAEARKPLTDMKERVNAVLRIYLQGVSRHDATEDIVNLLASRTAPVEPDPRYGRIASAAILEHPVGFYEEIERRLHAERIARVTTDRPANLHDYQGCVEQPAPNLDGAIWPDGLPNPTQKPVDQPEAAQEDAVARIAKTLHALVGKDPFATYREMAEAIIPVAREGYYSAEQVEKAVQDEINYCQLAHKMPRAFVDDVLFRLAHPKGEQHG